MNDIRRYLDILTEAEQNGLLVSAAFRRWFGNSKIVDAAGKPRDAAK